MHYKFNMANNKYLFMKKSYT